MAKVLAEFYLICIKTICQISYSVHDICRVVNSFIMFQTKRCADKNMYEIINATGLPRFVKSRSNPV